MHTILLSRGNVQKRIQVKKMLEGELFLEFLKEDPSDTDKITNISIWVCPADGQPPINVLHEVANQVTSHEKMWNASRDPNADRSYETGGGGGSGPDGWVDNLHPHGATSLPLANRLSAYDNDGMLHSVHPPETLDASNIGKATSAVTLKRQIQDFQKLTQLVADTKAELIQTINSIINGAPLALDQLNELAQALNNDPDFHNTIKGILDLKATKIELQEAKAQINQQMALLQQQIQNLQDNKLDKVGGHAIDCTCNTPPI